MKIYALLATVALSAFGCSRDGDKVIFHGDEAKEKTGEGAKELGRETKEEVKEGSREIEAHEPVREEPRETPPTATGGGPEAHDAGK